MTGKRSPRLLVGLLYLCGLYAAAQLGRMSALAPLIAVSLGLGLTTVASAVSLIEIGGASLGALAGLSAHWLGLRRTLRWAVAILALGGICGASAQGAAGLLGWRVLEAAGYLGVIVSAPVLIAHHAAAFGARAQGLALTLWSTFVPVGLALGSWAGASAATAWDWRAATAGGGAFGIVSWAVMSRADLPAHAEAPTAGPAAPLTQPMWCLALASGAFALFQVGVLGLLPTLLVREVGLNAQAAGQWTAWASVAAIAGGATTAWLLRHGIGIRGPMMVSLGLPPLLLFGVFTSMPAAGTAAGLAIGLNAVGGVFASLAFALLPCIATAPGQMVRANGLLAQCGAAGSLLGPPTMAACVQISGWTASAALGLVVSLAAMLLTWRAVSSPHRDH